jgi:hypothetical protein
VHGVQIQLALGKRTANSPPPIGLFQRQKRGNRMSDIVGLPA